MCMVESETRNKRTVRQACRPLSALQDELGIQGHSRSSLLVPAGIQNGVSLCRRNVQLMPTLFLKLKKIWQRENGKFVDFNDPTQV